MAATDFFTVEAVTFGRLLTHYVLVVTELSTMPGLESLACRTELLNYYHREAA